MCMCVYVRASACARACVCGRGWTCLRKTQCDDVLFFLKVRPPFRLFRSHVCECLSRFETLILGTSFEDEDILSGSHFFKVAVKVETSFEGWRLRFDVIRFPVCKSLKGPKVYCPSLLCLWHSAQTFCNVSKIEMTDQT